MDGFLILMHSTSQGTCVVGREALEARANLRAERLNKRAKYGVQYFVAAVKTMHARMAYASDDVTKDDGLAVPERAAVA